MTDISLELSLQHATILANYYEKFRHVVGAPHIKEYLRKAGITSLDVQHSLRKILAEISAIQDQQDEDNYSKSVDRGEVKPPKKPPSVEVIIGREFLTETTKGGAQAVQADPVEAYRTLDMVSKIAYKYQLKYTLLIFDVMAQDEKIWERIRIH